MKLEDILKRRNKCYKIDAYEDIDTVEEISDIAINHFRENYTNLIYPSKTYYSAIMYSMFMSCLTGISPWELLSQHIDKQYKFINQDTYFIPLCDDLIKNHKVLYKSEKDNLTDILTKHSMEDYVKSKRIWNTIIKNIELDDISIEKGTNKYVMQYFIKEFNIPEYEKELKNTITKVKKWW